MFKPGDQIDHYQVIAQLKSGGMATLFLARRQGAAGFAKHVAIKLIHSHLATNDRFVQMFVDEAMLSARIHHPNVVHVEELGETEGTYYLVMEYVHGGSLAQLLKALAKARRRMLPELAVSIAVAVADGLHAAHETTGDDGRLLGVVHRDVTPENVLIAFKGHVKLIDFGVAKARERTNQTTAGTLKGKFAYMAPEQAKGLAVDRRTDIYALGIVLWEMLTMRRLFKSQNDLELLDMVRDPHVRPPSELAPGIPPALDAVVLKALAPNADDRYPDGRAFRRALADAVPRALAMDASHLSDLMATVMHDEIQRERASIPESVSGIVEPRGASSVDQEEVLRTLTIDAADLESPAATVSSRGAAAGPPRAGGAPPPPPPVDGEPTGATPVVTPSGPGRSLAIAVVALIAILGGGFFGGRALFAPEETSSVSNPPPRVTTSETTDAGLAEQEQQPEPGIATPVGSSEADAGTDAARAALDVPPSVEPPVEPPPVATQMVATQMVATQMVQAAQNTWHRRPVREGNTMRTDMTERHRPTAEMQPAAMMEEATMVSTTTMGGRTVVTPFVDNPGF
ncbi:MAG: serine/threonine protein kinase [Deltaproteobacteria bacterium]|nr:serine/threonine protein kinase [Deltaproteobacteria bacterium]